MANAKLALWYVSESDFKRSVVALCAPTTALKNAFGIRKIQIRMGGPTGHP